MLQTTLAGCGSAGCGQAYLYGFVMICQRPWLRRKATHWSAARRNHPRQRRCDGTKIFDHSSADLFTISNMQDKPVPTVGWMNVRVGMLEHLLYLCLRKEDMSWTCLVMFFFHFFSSLSIKKDSLDLTRQKLEWHGAQLCVWEREPYAHPCSITMWSKSWLGESSFLPLWQCTPMLWGSSLSWLQGDQCHPVSQSCRMPLTSQPFDTFSKPKPFHMWKQSGNCWLGLAYFTNYACCPALYHSWVFLDFLAFFCMNFL